MSKVSENQGFAGGKSEAVMHSPLRDIGSPCNSGQCQACDALVMCALVAGCAASWDGPVW